MLRRHAWPIAIAFAVFCFNMLSSSREPAWGDAHGMWELADHMVVDGKVDIGIRWPEDIPAGRNGKYYGISPIGTSLVHVPGAAIAYAAHSAAPSYDPLIRPLATHLAPALLGALACAVFFGLLRDLGIGTRTASLTTAILACATTTWVYARYPYSEILQLACFTGFFRQLLRVAEAPTNRRAAIWLGIWAGCLFNAKYVFGIAIAGGGAILVWKLRRDRRVLVRLVAWAAVGGAPLLALALWYNWVRWGAVTHTGYEPYLDAFFGGSVFDGAWGMLASPNKSLFLYSPPLVLAVFGLPAAIRARRTYGVALACMVAPVFVTYCTYRSWSGDYAWGPRFAVWMVPVLLVGLAFFWDVVAARWHRRVRVGVLAVVVAGGIGVQVLGNSLYWDHFIRIAMDAKNQWLGQPNRSGSYIADRGRGHCDSCFEDTYELLWTPPFQPMRGHWWLLKTLARDDDAANAQVDAPWRGYTHLQMNLAANFGRVRIDWWGMIWLFDAGRTWPLGLALLIVMILAMAAGIWWWVRLHRAPAPESDS